MLQVSQTFSLKMSPLDGDKACPKNRFTSHFHCFLGDLDFKVSYEEVVDHSFLLKALFLLLYENFLLTFYYIFVIEYGTVIIVVIFQTKVFIIVKQFAK